MPVRKSAARLRSHRLLALLSYSSPTSLMNLGRFATGEHPARRQSHRRKNHNKRTGEKSLLEKKKGRGQDEGTSTNKTGASCVKSHRRVHDATAARKSKKTKATQTLSRAATRTGTQPKNAREATREKKARLFSMFSRFKVYNHNVVSDFRRELTEKFQTFVAIPRRHLEFQEVRRKSTVVGCLVHIGTRVHERFDGAHAPPSTCQVEGCPAGRRMIRGGNTLWEESRGRGRRVRRSAGDAAREASSVRHAASQAFPWGQSSGREARPVVIPGIPGPPAPLITRPSVPLFNRLETETDRLRRD